MKLVLSEPDSPVARRLWQRWTDKGEELMAPTLFRAETLSVVRRNVSRGIIGEQQAEAAYNTLDRLGVEAREPLNLYRVAWEYARRFNRPTVYDCCYLALAAVLGCDLWTADLRLANAIQARLPWVHVLGTAGEN